MKIKLRFWFCLALILALAPVYALAGDVCTDGTHDMIMSDVHYPTCTTDGYYILECRLCDYTKKEITDKATGCDYEDAGLVSPTCTEAGYQSYVCKNCGDTYKVDYDPLGHDWKDDGVSYPDCSSPGVEKMHCARCGEKWENEIPAQGHSFVETAVITEATCEKGGKIRLECEACGVTINQDTEPKGHNWKITRTIKEATCTAEGKAEVECRDCGKEATRTLKKTEHTYGEWIITKQPTEKTKGTRTAACLVCGKKTKESIEYVPGAIAIYTRTGKVNLRAGAGKNHKQMGQVAKKGTYLGQLYEAAPDKNGDVWYKVKYKGNYRWVMAEYANAVVDEDALTKERLPEATGTELTNYFFRSAGPVVETLELVEASTQDEPIAEWQNEAVYMSGEPYVEQIALYGEGYSLYGIKVGDKIKNALKVLDKKSLVLADEDKDRYTYRVPALPDALSVDEDGFCGYLVVNVSQDDTVDSVLLYSDTAEYIYSTY